ncbi:iron-sulfur cluster assembly scaffold protein [Novosphingobium sp.]|uniref:iron-sulfur cluster assembly scaffold protein n=1 Tax=Novosphingobium sp. TaxID=1874826 RepID=UPI003D14F2CE
MTARTTLYTPAVLAAATGLAAWPWHDAAPHVGQARSRTCGSTLTMGLTLDASGRVSAIGIRAHACAIGQASASAFARGATGQTRDDISRARAELGAWLAGEGDLATLAAQWPDIAIIAHARALSSRHGAIMLAWDAALEALK